MPAIFLLLLNVYLLLFCFNSIFFSEDHNLDSISLSDDDSLSSESMSSDSEQNSENESIESYDPDIGYDSEDSENERTLNTIGDVPLRWYEEFDHIGYDLEGAKIARPAQEDKIDEFLALNEDPKSWRSVYDEETGKRIIISDKEMDYIRKIQKGVSSSRYDPEKWFIELSGATDDVMPTTATPEPKRRFIPSKWEALRIRKLAYAIRKGRIKLDKEEKPTEPQFFLIWDQQENETVKRMDHIPPPKPKLPGHSESYNPSDEYLFDEEELEEYNETPIEERKENFIPQKFNSLREVPSYKAFHKERFERCLDLYLRARARRKKPPVDLSTLVAHLPKPSELKPYPSQEAFQFNGHAGIVRTMSIDPSGQWIISGGDDKTIRLWEIKTTRCIKVWNFDTTIYSIEWNPNKKLSLIAVGTGNSIVLLMPPNATRNQKLETTELFEGLESKVFNGLTKDSIEWVRPSEDEIENGIKLKISASHDSTEAKYLTWHAKGDYLANIFAGNQTSSVLIHQISKQQTQAPFKKNKGDVQCIKFHPTKPFFFVANQKSVRVYHLVKQELTKKLSPSVQWISSLDVHPEGDNIIIGSYDRKICWFDLDLSTKPYKSLKYHQFCVRSVKYHKNYPLFASCSDDGSIHVFHGTVYSDLLSNPLIVPLKILRGHNVVDDLGVLDIVFHPTQPWIFSAGDRKSVV